MNVYVGNESVCRSVAKSRGELNTRTQIVSDVERLRGLDKPSLILCHGWGNIPDMNTEVLIQKARGASVEIAL